ncbi:DUF6912 family protein [Streptomyces sp. NPDC005435]|uniref:DUF6912 family protein n=1 Tax=Streptomyces sp. NPDC005435 TaxID=3154464 RepID=UPI003456BCCC
MRVYVPLTLPGLAEAYRTGVLGTGSFVAYAVTPDLRQWCGSEDLEELEYAALGQAALASLRLLAADESAAPRRVVVAADVPDRAVAPGPYRDEEPAELGEVMVTAEVPLAKAAAVHADAEDAEPDVAAAAAALAEADAGDDHDLAAVETADRHELLWYATQEIPSLLRRP